MAIYGLGSTYYDESKSYDKTDVFIARNVTVIGWVENRILMPMSL
jgi:hypothetical protein